jgi:hypothetical protein
MSTSVLSERSIVLRLEFSIADAVRDRGLVHVVIAAVTAWWQLRPVNPSTIPASLRADIGLQPLDEPMHWTGIDLHSFRLGAEDRRRS